MAFLRKEASGNYSLSFNLKGGFYIKALGTEDLEQARQIKQYAEEQPAHIRRGESALAAKLLADGHSIVDVLFASRDLQVSQVRQAQSSRGQGRDGRCGDHGLVVDLFYDQVCAGRS